jgi:hypothetical protein
MKIKSIILVGCVFLLSKPLLAQEKDYLPRTRWKLNFWATSNFSMVCPDEATVQKSFDFLDLSRGVEAFLSGMPATSIYAMLEGLKEAGLKPGDLGLFGGLMDARTLFLTAQSTTPYAFLQVDLKMDRL